MILSNFMSRHVDVSPRPAAVLSLRLALAALAIAVSFVASGSIGSVISLVGGACSLSTSMLLPSAFYAQLSWQQQGTVARVGLCFLLSFGVTIILLVTTKNVEALLGGGNDSDQLTGENGEAFGVPAALRLDIEQRNGQLSLAN
jgi:amino acid permease